MNTRPRREAERRRLGDRRVDELVGGDEHRRDAPALEIDDVVHTARRAAASIGERLDHDFALVAISWRRSTGAGLVNVGLR